MKSISIKNSNVTEVKDNGIDFSVCFPTCISLMVLLSTVPMLSKHIARQIANTMIYVIFPRVLTFD